MSLGDKLASDFGVKAAQADGECLERGDRIPEVHGEQVLPDLAELEYHVVVLATLARSRHQLEVLHRRDRDPPVEVEAPALQRLVPPGGLVLQHRLGFVLGTRRNT